MENITNPIDGAPDVAAAEEVLVRSVSIEQADGELSRSRQAAIINTTPSPQPYIPTTGRKCRKPRG